MSAAVAQLLKTRRLPGGWSQQDPPGLSGGLSVGQLVWDEFIVSATGGAALRLPFVQPEPDDAAVVLFTWGKSTEGGGRKRGEKGGRGEGMRGHSQTQPTMRLSVMEGTRLGSSLVPA